MIFSCELDKNKKYLLACSFGPDSMALFDMLLKENIDFEVAHVNYHKRDVSDFEEKSLIEYCNAHKISIEVLDSRTIEQEGNFQAWAREIRYKFFKDVVIKNNLAGVIVAHQMDDVIETYLMQIQRNSTPTTYGLDNSEIFGIPVFRPLLNYRKKDLLEYNNENNIPYSIDVSNLSDDYERNKIRHSIVEKLTNEECLSYLEEIRIKNEKLTSIKAIATEIGSSEFTTAIAKTLTKEIYIGVLQYRFKLLRRRFSLSNVQIDELLKLLNSKKSNIKLRLADNLYYYQEYGVINIFEDSKKYTYKIDIPVQKKFNEFEIDFTNGAEDRNINYDSYPITIRSSNKNDSYLINNYKVKVSRLFLDWKMPIHLRDVWPIVEDKNGNIIYIPRYRKDFVDNHKSLFKIKLK